MASSSGHSWEQRCHSFDGGGRLGQDGIWGQSDEEDEQEATGPAAGDCLVEYLLDMHYEGRLSAKAVCVACWFAHKAGAQGSIGRYAFRPNAPTGHYQRHLDSVMGVDVKAEMAWRYSVLIPQHSKYDTSRSTHPCFVNLPHEALSEEVLQVPNIMDRVGSTTWPRAYYNNPIVQRSARPVLPIALYLDGVPTTNRDGCLGIFVYNLVTMKRHLIAVVRKRRYVQAWLSGLGFDSPHMVLCTMEFGINGGRRVP